MKPLLAIIGRPNVGKSTLFNRIAGKRRALVEDFAGVTRDRHYAEASWDGLDFLLVDTGGFEPHSDDPILTLMREQASLAIEEADAILFLADGREGITPADHDTAAILRQCDKPLIFAANKIDGERHEAEAFDFYRLGVSEVFPISALHGRGMADLLDRIVEILPFGEDEEEALPEEVPKIAVIGRPNVGKSTLVNQLLGESRHLTHDQPGTTRDPIDTLIERGEKRFMLIDTAGIRRKRSINQHLERAAVIKAFKAMDRADVAWILIDAVEGIVEQDIKVAAFAHDKGRAVILVINKWDAVKERNPKKFLDYIERRLSFLTYAPLSFISARTGRRVENLLATTEKIFKEYKKRISTGELNRFLEGVVRHHAPPRVGNRQLKLFYITQIGVEPPTFLISCNHAKDVHFSYQRYIINSLRETFGFEGVPLKVVYRQRGNRDGDKNRRR